MAQAIVVLLLVMLGVGSARETDSKHLSVDTLRVELERSKAEIETDAVQAKEEIDLAAKRAKNEVLKEFGYTLPEDLPEKTVVEGQRDIDLVDDGAERTTGWMEFTEEGRTFYFNSATAEVTWTRPDGTEAVKYQDTRDPRKMTKRELQQELNLRGQSSDGRKADLVLRVEEMRQGGSATDPKRASKQVFNLVQQANQQHSRIPNFDAMLNQNAKMEVAPHWKSASVPPSEKDITLLVQADCTRAVRRLNVLAEQWNGPISAALLCTKDTQLELNDVLEKESVRKHVDIHMCLAPEKPEYYPINKMRNVASANSRGEWVMVLDMDEDPLFSMKEYREEMNTALLKGESQDHIFAVASFQWDNSKGPRIPKSIADLNSMPQAVIKAKLWERAYTPPGLGVAGWKNLKDVKPVKFADGYEPYFIAKKSVVGEFDERFQGWGSNYAIHTLKLALNQKHFSVLPRVFTFTDELTEVMNDHKPPMDPELQVRACVEISAKIGCAGCDSIQHCVAQCPNSVWDPAKEDVKEELPIPAAATASSNSVVSGSTSASEAVAKSNAMLLDHVTQQTHPQSATDIPKLKKPVLDIPYGVLDAREAAGSNDNTRGERPPPDLQLLDDGASRPTKEKQSSENPTKEAGATAEPSKSSSSPSTEKTGSPIDIESAIKLKQQQQKIKMPAITRPPK